MPEATSTARSQIAGPFPALSSLPGLVAAALVGFVLAIFGTYWDDAWHTDTGRDSFLIAPHVALYLGITLAGGALTAWAVLGARRAGWASALRHPPLTLALIGVGLTLVAAPIDNAWHLAFGRDAVVWSPPHMLGIAGSLAIAAGLLLELARPEAATSGRRRATALIAAAAVIAVAALPVLEYETDVPQFAALLYLPILTGGAAFAFGLIAQVLPEPWSVTSASLIYTALMAAVALVLVVAEMPAPLVPALAVAAAGFDYLRPRRSLGVQAVALAGLVFATYVPYLNWVKNGVYLDLSDVALGFPLAAGAAMLGLWLTSGPRLPSRPQTVAAAAALVLLLPVASALAHDPGQGDEVGTATIEAAVRDATADVVVSPRPVRLCDELEPVAAVARRGGETVRGPLVAVPGCRFRGTVDLPERGRWFVYAEWRRGDQTVETWTAVDSDAGRTEAGDRSVYIAEEVSDPLGKKVAGIAVYSLFAATLVAIPIVYRRARRG